MHPRREHTTGCDQSWALIGSAVQAVMIVADDKQSLQITGNGDVLEPHDGIIGARFEPCVPVSRQGTASVRSQSTSNHLMRSYRVWRSICAGRRTCFDRG